MSRRKGSWLCGEEVSGPRLVTNKHNKFGLQWFFRLSAVLASEKAIILYSSFRGPRLNPHRSDGRSRHALVAKCKDFRATVKFDRA